MSLILVEIGPHELGTKPLNEMDPKVQNTEATLDLASAKEGSLPHTADKDQGGRKVNTTDTGAKEQAPLDGPKTDNPTGNKDTADGGSVSVLPLASKFIQILIRI
ncbi:hypothetical protein AAF712_007816 [Marasmius tenuissimus]|uniref:Uncharacterized protein n=1 Tax=Marasmius tenuissimus TaxID=585030 RepID=A0ABR2ZVM9_9AGAR